MSTTITPFACQRISTVQRGSFLDGTFVHNSCQSMCYDSRNKKYIVGFAMPGNVSALIRMQDLSFKKSAIELIATELPLEHCNDLAYDPDEHKIYAVGGGYWVAIVDPETLQVEQKIHIGMVAWSIARYPNGDWFIHNGDHGERYSHDFSRCTIISIDDWTTIIKALNVPYREKRGDYAGCWQGAIVLDGVPYKIFNEFSLKTGDAITFVLMFCEMSSDRTIYRADVDCEVESADIVNGKMMLAYNHPRQYGGGEWDMSEYFMKTVYGEIEHVEIPAGKEVQIEFAKYVPEGYQLVSANVTVRKADNSIRTLPIFIGGNCMLRIQKVVKNRIYIRSTDRVYNDLTLYVTGFCRKI